MPLPLFVEGRLASLADVSGNVSATVTDSGGEPINITVVGSKPGISDNILTTLVTMVANGYNRLVQISVSGTSYAKYQLFINSSLKETRRSGPERNLYFTYNHPIKLLAGDVVDLKVIHYNVGQTADFEATIFAYHT